MRKSIIFAAALVVLPGCAFADYLIKDGSGALQTVFAYVIGGKILPASVPTDPTGNTLAGVAGSPTAYAMTVQPQPTSRAKTTSPTASLVVKNGSGNLRNITVTIGVTTGYLMLFDAVAQPSNGAVTPAYCYPILSNGTLGGVSDGFDGVPFPFTTGITAVFSSTGCTTLTASSTAMFYAGYN